MRLFAATCLTAAFVLFSANDLSAELPKNGCFDLSTGAGVKALSKPIPFDSPTRTDTTASGPNPRGGGWGSARAMLAMPIQEALKQLRDQKTLKNPDDSDVEVKHEKRPGLIDWQSVDITIHPFPLVSVDWTEQWAYKLTQGTAAKPKAIMIAYQKTQGTNHLKHFCGNIWLKAEGAKTDFAVYEETEATRRSHEDIAKGHLGTIRTIRGNATAAKATLMTAD